MCPQCARKLFRKKIEALRRQHEAEQEKNEREQRKRAKAGIGLTGKDAAAAQNASKHAQGFPSRGGVSVDMGGAAGSSDTSGETATPGGSPAGSGLDEGHDFVRQAVAAAGGGDTNSGSKKRSRHSRWGGRPSVSAGGGMIKGGASSGDGGGLGVGVGDEEAGAGGSSASNKDEAARKAWAGELERDRTAEDEMDDFLSSLLL